MNPLRLRLPTVGRLFGSDENRRILEMNPTIIPSREESKEVSLSIYDFDAENLEEWKSRDVSDCLRFKGNKHLSWINIDGLRKEDIEKVCGYFGVHELLVEDILSINQRPKMDEVGEVMFCLLNMLYFNDDNSTVEAEQISIVLGKTFVVSFQEDANRDVFDPVRQRIRSPKSQIRLRSADYLLYCMIDMIVDNYFLVMEKVGGEIEQAEEDVFKRRSSALPAINRLRKELIILKRNIIPVRDMVSSILRSDSDLINERTIKYFKDIQDHISQAHDLLENYRDMVMGLQDLYLNSVNLRMNEVMKVMAIVTCLLAPATVIGGIFGMNFDVIPYSHHEWGFYFAVGTMLAIPFAMLWIFWKRDWF